MFNTDGSNKIKASVVVEENIDVPDELQDVALAEEELVKDGKIMEYDDNL